MTDPDEIARCAAARRTRREALHCGECGRPYTSAIGAPECDCPPIKLRMDVPAPVVQQACTATPAKEHTPDEPPPSGWRERPALL